MNTAILRKTAREFAGPFAIAALSVLVFEPLLVLAIGNFASDVLPLWSRFPYVQQLVSALVGADITAGVTTTSLITLGLAHPFVFAVTWTFLIAACSRAVAGEMDRGTAELLLTLPVSRVSVWLTVSLVAVASAIALSLMPWLGIVIGCAWFPLPEPVEIARLWAPTVNLAALLASIAGMSLLASTWSGRRGPAVAVAIGAVLCSFLLNFLVALGPRWRFAAPFTLLHYYRPLESVRSSAFPIRDVAVLSALAASTWAAGLAHFSRRDIPTA